MSRCVICEGKIVNGRCQDCGMDYSRRKANYRLNETRSEAEQKRQDPAKVGKAEQKWQDPVRTDKRAGKKSAPVFEKKKKQKGKTLTGAALAGVTAVLLVGVIGTAFTSFMEESEISDSEFAYQEGIQDPYEFVEEAMPKEGGDFLTELSQGTYMGGQQLPAGTYTAKVVSSQLGGSIYLEDHERGIYVSEYLSMDEADGIKKVEDLRLYSGGKLEIQGDLILELHAENAQLDTQQKPEKNPLTKTVTLSKTTKVGEQLPAGLYDIQVEAGWGSLLLQNEDQTYHQGIYLSSETGENFYCNVTLEEGMTVYVEEYSSENFTVTLIPSPDVYD